MATKGTGGKKPGDTNHSLREKKFLAQIEKLKADVAAVKAQVKVKDAQIKETREKLRSALDAATKPPAAKKAPGKKPSK